MDVNQSLIKGELEMNILLCCAAGMSTSLLVTKMEKSAKEKEKACKIWAVPGDAVRKRLI